MVVLTQVILHMLYLIIIKNVKNVQLEILHDAILNIHTTTTAQKPVEHLDTIVHLRLLRMAHRKQGKPKLVHIVQQQLPVLVGNKAPMTINALQALQQIALLS